MTAASESGARAVGRWGWLFVALLGVSCAGFIALGIWQLQRLSWKTTLIERVESRTRAQPVSVPGPLQWPGVTPATHEYLRVRLQGRWQATADRPADIWVRTGTELGWGFWLMSPLQTREGFRVLVNRGFVPAEQRNAVIERLKLQRQAGQDDEVQVTGLLRMSEAPSLLRGNEPAENRWASRDVPAMAQAMGLGNVPVAPFFVDAFVETPAASPTDARSPGWPRPGLTVVRFNNNHLSYALTWFALAALCGGGCWLLLRARNS